MGDRIVLIVTRHNPGFSFAAGEKGTEVVGINEDGDFTTMGHNGFLTVNPGPRSYFSTRHSILGDVEAHDPNQEMKFSTSLLGKRSSNSLRVG